MRSKLISCVLVIAMLLTLSVPAFAADSQVSEYTFSDNVTNDFTEDDSRIWTFEPVKARSGNALVQEPGIRSVSSGSGKKYTSIKLNCPFYGSPGIIFRNNNLYWHIAW